MSENIQYINNVGSDENGNHHSCKVTTVSTGNPEKKIQPSESKCLQLRFKSNRMPDVVYTGRPKGREGISIEVVLVDGLTGNVLKSGSEAPAEVEILALRKAFNKNDTDNWTSEEFEESILKGKGRKPSLLARTRINLIEGCGSINDIFFRHTRYPLRNTGVRLGARVIQAVDSSDGTRVREAVSEPFTVKDRRGMNKKDYQLSLTDKVSRLKNIGKDGPSHKKLRTEGIDTVEDFLTKHLADPQNLQNILGETMSPKKLEATINHAKTCEDDMEKPMHFPPTGVVLKNVEEELDSFSAAKHDASQMVSDIYKAEASDMVVAPFKNWGEDVSVDDDSSKPFLVANSDGTKIINSMLGQRFDILGVESMSGTSCEEFLWDLLDKETINRALCDNEHQQFFDPFDPFQSTIFCSPADLRSVLHEVLVRDIPLDKPRTQRGWKLLFSILRWFSIRRIVARKHPVRGIKRYRQEQMSVESSKCYKCKCSCTS